VDFKGLINGKFKPMSYNDLALTKIHPVFRKAANIAFVLFFLLTTSGLAIQENFCYGKLLSVYVEKTSDKCCDTPCPGCHIKIVTLKIADTFLETSKKINDKAKSIIKCPLFACANENIILSVNRQKIHNHLNLFSAPKFALNQAQLQVFLC
jgi:hypothetical protein